jgi:hypothetical protein
MRINAKENAWRRICNTILGAANRATAIPVQLVAFEQYEHVPQTDWVEEPDNDGNGEQGKAEGSST